MHTATSRIVMALTLCGCADEYAEQYLGCAEGGDCFFVKAEWEEIQTFALDEDEVMPEPGHNFGLDQGRAEAVGYAIFIDTQLGPHGVSCATCHPPEQWFTSAIDRREPGSDAFRGITSVIDVVYYEWHKWDGAKKTMTELLQGAITKESLVNGDPVAIAQHVQEASYASRFAELCGENYAFDCVAWFLEAYIRTIVSEPTRFDAYVQGEFDELDDAEKRGLRLFIGDAHCSACHSGPRFSDGGFHDIGLAEAPETGDRQSVIAELAKTNPELDPDDPVLSGAFRTPSLRNVAMTPPYMHTSDYDELEEVVWHYMNTTEAHDGALDPKFWPADITDEEAADLVAFLRTLTSTSCPWTFDDKCP